MTQNAITESVAQQVRSVRRSQGLSAERLAARCAELGMSSLDRSTIANIESGRRQRIGVDELVVLAQALNKSPMRFVRRAVRVSSTK